MIIKLDAGQLEWRAYVELSRDQIALSELQAGEDIHAKNISTFGLPTRLISKVFLFRWIYRGSAWAYANDPDFIPVSRDPKFWQEVIDRANQKYYELYNYQEAIIARVKRFEIITIPSGREWLFELQVNKKTGEKYWDIKQIVNYINQGFGADIVLMGRVMLRKLLLNKYNNKDYKWFNTVHDDIQLDVVNNAELCYNICIDLENLFPRVPQGFKNIYGYDFVTPLIGEVYYGPNLGSFTKFDKNKGKEQYGIND